MWVIRALLVMVLIVVIVGFSVLNSEERVTVQLHDTTYYNIPLIVVTYWSFVAGMVVTFVLGSPTSGSSRSTCVMRGATTSACSPN